jgi:hypothetical protein
MLIIIDTLTYYHGIFSRVIHVKPHLIMGLIIGIKPK